MVRRSANHTHARRALTLMEMMVAMLVAALIAVLIIGVIRTTVVITGEGASDEQRGSRNERIRTFLTTQVAWLDLTERVGGSEEPQIVGESGWMMTRSLVALQAPHRREPVVARLLVEASPDGPGGYSLLYAEQTREHDGLRARRRGAANDPVAALQAFEEGMSRSRMRPLLERCLSIEIAYLERQAGGLLEWQPEWIGRPSLPRAVRITWVSEEGATREWIMPVAVTF
ncbi:MAG: hypothetical protein EA379_10455 [Phycisphaerales bacterium]|nr:MAG: hypothetical protein EA379_10455 [Phycisphaerales bacterium]